jgi:pyruvate dehydrogenase E2 component (dihydrolipoamide acetyltransferase)
VVSRDGGFVAQSYCRLTLSADHRVIDGAAAAGFLSELKALLQDPIGLLL